ncbi:polysaccharide deacetylase [Pseudoroseomonas rhizosphaerae]|uniref:Polysaccharide deacetylase n=1 Tax=Teichococcus rhizosphaerae TaxID=1335062 RepID=A0A2C7A5S5_9PROT|nr:polysaccharide deacetylase [Pseudoroseomonas rhizosphaerae]PHK93690.1 polysaccharide deacetylase [Pseudoroseomonas rhizosphaerae]
MQPLTAASSIPSFVPLALEEEDIAAYAAIASGLGCPVERCAEGFMLATPAAREAALRLWQAILILGATAELDAGQRALHRAKADKARADLRALLGLEPRTMPPEALVAAGLRYQH